MISQINCKMLRFRQNSHYHNFTQLNSYADTFHTFPVKERDSSSLASHSQCQTDKTISNLLIVSTFCLDGPEPDLFVKGAILSQFLLRLQTEKTSFAEKWKTLTPNLPGGARVGEAKCRILTTD